MSQPPTTDGHGPTGSGGGDFQARMNRLIEISIALSAERKLDVLLERILTSTREITGADAGTLYRLQDGRLHFEVIQNATLGIATGGTTGEKTSLEPVKLDKANVCAYAAILGRTVAIADVYESREFDFSGPRHYDRVTGYRSRSMLVVPMKNHAGVVTGVLQLLNATEPGTGAVVPFRPEDTAIVEALASQAAVAIDNVTLIQETKDLFEAVIRVMAAAVDAKSHYTGNHIQRVAILNSMLAQAVHDTAEGPLAEIRFSEPEMEAIRIAGWLHDIGKITTPVCIMDKATKLETLMDRLELVELRFRLIRELLRRQTGAPTEPAGGPAEHTGLAARLAELDGALAAVRSANVPAENADPALLARVQEISRRTYLDDGVERPYLTPDETENLSIRRGTLTEDQRRIMQTHVEWTNRLLSHIPFKGHLADVPVFAGQHHERLNGRGYPDGAGRDRIPIQSRILAIADFYEALSAKDRPYRRPMSKEEIIAIMRESAAREEIDGDVLEVMIRSDLIDAFEALFEDLRQEGLSAYTTPPR